MMGMNHFMKMGMMTGYAGSKGVPAAKLAVMVTGSMLMGGGLGILLGVYVQYAVLLLVAFLVPVALKMHNFWAIEDPNQKVVEMLNFMRNMAFTGAVLMLLAIPTPWYLSLNL